MSQPTHLVVNLSSVYEPADLGYASIVAISASDLAQVGFSDINEMAKRLSSSSPSSRRGEDEDTQIPIPGCDENGSFVEKDLEAPVGEEPGPGNNGLYWTSVGNLREFTFAHYCVVVNAYMDQ